jgi:type I restriction enzyme S subunit
MKEYKVKDLLTIRNGRDHKQLGEGKYPVYGSGGILRYVDSYLYNKPSILLPRKGTLDNIQYCDKPFWCVDTTYYSEVNTSLANPYFLYCYLSILNLKGLDSGTALPSMTFDSYYQINVSLPSIEIQNKIGEILFNIDQKISLNTRMNAELEAMAKQLYDYWFVQFDFPDENGKPYKSSGGKMVYNEKLKREIPEGWEVKTISDCIYPIERGMSYTSASIVNPEGIPMINLACFSKQGNYRIGELKFYSGDYNQNLLVKQGDLLFACTDMTRDADIIGSPIIVNKEYDSYVFSSDLARITPKTIRKSYLYFAMKNKRFHTYIKRYATGSLVLHLNIDGVNNYPIIIPPIALQVVYSNFFWPLRHIIDENINESNHLTHLRDSLLPMLMNGQVTIE